MKNIDLVYRADGNKGADDGGAIRTACKAICEKVDYGVSGISARIYGLNTSGKKFCDRCPDDCIVEIIGGDPAIYQAEVTSWEDIDQQIIGRNIAEAREAAGLTLDILAGRVGTSRQQIIKYESGSQNMGVVRLIEIAAAIGIEPDKLLKGIVK